MVFDARNEPTISAPPWNDCRIDYVELTAISKEIFEFPGGRRFEFTDPSGNELAVWSDKWEKACSFNRSEQG
jgi:hypothetical protein